MTRDMEEKKLEEEEVGERPKKINLSWFFLGVLGLPMVFS